MNHMNDGVSCQIKKKKNCNFNRKRLHENELTIALNENHLEAHMLIYANEYDLPFAFTPTCLGQ